MRRCLLSSLIWVLAELSATNTLAAIVPELDLTSLCDRADLVVVGRAEEVRDSGPVALVSGETISPGRLMVVHLTPERVLKGVLKGTSVTFTFSLPATSVVSALYTPITAGQFGVFFLRKGKQGFEVLDPYYPSVVASPGAPQTARTLLEQITEEVAHVFTSPGTSVDLKQQAVRVLQSMRTPAANAALGTATRNQPPEVRIAAISALLTHSDISELAAAEDLLLHPPPRR